MMNSPIAAVTLLVSLTAPGLPVGAPEWARAADMLQQHVTIHVPRVTVTSSTTTIIMRSAPPVPMKEKKADDCVKVEKIRGFSVNRMDSVDLLLSDGKVLRAKLGDDCPALGFYTGFYVKASPDKKICAKRDAFRSRSGRSCGVQAFRSLVPAK